MCVCACARARARQRERQRAPFTHRTLLLLPLQEVQNYVDENEWLRQDEISAIWEHWRGVVAVPEPLPPPQHTDAPGGTEDWASGVAEQWAGDGEEEELDQPTPDWTARTLETCLSKVAAVAAHRQSTGARVENAARQGTQRATDREAARDRETAAPRIEAAGSERPEPAGELWEGQHAQQQAAAESAARRQRAAQSQLSLEPEPEPERPAGGGNYWPHVPQRSASALQLETDSEAASVMSDVGDERDVVYSLLEQSSHHRWVGEVGAGFRTELSPQQPPYASEDGAVENGDSAGHDGDAPRAQQVRRRGAVSDAKVAPTRRGAMTGEMTGEMPAEDALAQQYGSLDEPLEGVPTPHNNTYTHAHTHTHTQFAYIFLRSVGRSS